MNFARDFTETERGDLYPIIKKSGEISENVSGGIYSVSGSGSVCRLIGSVSP
jgi:hypothetical protein